MSITSRSSLILTSTTLILGMGLGLAPAASAIEPVSETTGSSSFSVTDNGPDAYNAQVLLVINQERAKVGSPALRWNPGIAPVAESWSNHLTEATKSFEFDWKTIHRSDAGGSLIPQGSTWYSEIIAFNTTPERIVAWWISSPSHRDAMLDPRVTDIGIGYNIPDTGPYAGQHMVVANMADYSNGVSTVTPAGVSFDAPAVIPVAAPPFNDVADSLFLNEITWMNTTGIANGNPDGTFKPKDAVNRDAMALFLYRMAGSPEYTAPEVSPYTDVATDHPAYKEIAWLNTTGISTGYGDGTYHPDENLTRETMSSFMKRFAGDYCGIPAAKDFQAYQTSFTDTALSPQFNDMEWTKAAAVTTGFSDGSYRPAANVTREGMSAFMYRLNDYIALDGGC